MYVTMMMTDQIPLDLAPPPLLNGEVPLMPHMVNGDAAQQVNTCMSVVCVHLASQMLLSTFLCCRTHSDQTHARTHIKEPGSHFPLLSFRHVAHGFVATGNEQLLQYGICHIKQEVE